MSQVGIRTPVSLIRGTEKRTVEIIAVEAPAQTAGLSRYRYKNKQAPDRRVSAPSPRPPWERLIVNVPVVRVKKRDPVLGVKPI